MSPPRHSRTATSTRTTCRSDADMLAGAAAGHAVNAIFPNDETLARQKRGLKAIFTRFLTAANTERGIRGLGLVESQILRRCPTCMAEDRSLYGCAHWRLFHQWPVVRHCALHGDLLQSKCARCHMPFVRGNQARLADDVCPHCHSINGAADPFIPPAGYWPLVRLMFSTLTGHAPSLATIHRSIAALDIQPGRIGLGADTTRAQRMARRTCHAWNVGSVYELAAALGVNWIWSNETERSASLREWPPMVKLALAANDEPYRYELKSANDEPIRLPLAA